MLLITSTGGTATEERNRKMILAGTDIIRINICRRNIEKNLQVRLIPLSSP